MRKDEPKTEPVRQKICEAIERPDHLPEQAPQVVDQIRESQSFSEEERTRIQHELEAVLNERQWAITQARKGAFTVSDIEKQLNQLTFQEITLKGELSSLGEAKNINPLDKWEARSVAPFKPKVWKQLNERNLIAV